MPRTSPPRLTAVQVLVSLSGDEPKLIDPALRQWLDRTKQKQELAGRAETWLLALAALRHENTRNAGLDLAIAVAKSAALSGNSGRQQVAIAAITLHAGDRADKLVQELMAGRKGDPRTLYQIAQVHFQRKQYTKAVKALEEVWRRDPGFIMPKIRQLIDYYVKAEQLDSLAKSLRGVSDQQLVNRYPFEVPNSFRNLPKNPKLAMQVVDLYLAGIEMAPEHSSYIASQLNQYLRGLPQNEKTLAVYLKVVLPTKQNPGEIQHFAKTLVDLASTAKRIESVKTQCLESIKQHPQWEARGRLLLAMLDARAGDPQPMVELAKKYQSDTAFAARLKNETDLLRRQLAESDQRPALELALKLWREQMSAESGDSIYGTQQVAALLVKLGDRKAARQTLLAALYRPSSIGDTTNEEYIEQNKLQRLQSLANEFKKHDFTRDAITAYARTSTVDASKFENSYYLQQLLECQTSGRKLIQQLLKSSADQTLADLETMLGNIAKTPNFSKKPGLASEFAAFFTVFDVSGQDGKSSAPDSILPGVLEHAKQKQRLDSLRQLVTKARQKHSDAHQLVALDILCQLALEHADRAKGDLAELVSRAKKSPDDAVWLVARVAMKNAETREQGHVLAELVAIHAAKMANRTRQEAAVLSLTNSLSANGQKAKAAELMSKLIGGSKDSPESRLQMARILFNQKRGSEAVKTLEPVWKSQPALLLGQFKQLTPMYFEADAVDQLVEGLAAVTDTDLQRRYDSQIVSSSRDFARSTKRVDDGIKLLRATVKFSESGNHSYAIGTLASHLKSKNRKAEAWTVYQKAVLPPTGPKDRLSSLASTWISLTLELKNSNELQSGAKQAVMAHPEWTSSYDLLVAMARFRKEKNEDGYVKLVKQYRADSEYAKALENSSSILRTELAKCSSKNVLQLAVELWEPEIDRIRRSTSSSSNSYQQFNTLAQLLLKLDRRDQARKLLLEAVDAPMPRYSSSYIAYYHFRRSEYLAPKFQAAGFHLDAVRLMQKHQSLVGTETAKQRRLGSRLTKQQNAIRTSIHAIFSEQLDDAVQQLEAALKESPPGLDMFFAPVSRAWTSDQISKIPKHVRGGSPASTQFLPATLRHAQKQQRIESLKKSVNDATKKHPKHHQLAALNIFLNHLDTKADDMLPALIQMSRIEDHGVRALSLATLGQMKQPAATTAIVAAAQDRDSKLMAIDLLRRQRTPDAAKALGRWFGESDPMIRLRVFAALRRMRTPEAKRAVRLERVAFDGFDGKAKLNWKVIKADPANVWFDKQPGMMTIKAKNGGFAAKTKNFANVYLIENPATGSDFQVTICVAGFTPKEPYQQAALLCWNDDDNYVKFSFESTKDGKPRVTLFPERNGRHSRRIDRVMPTSTNRLWLRLTKFGDRYQCATSKDGKSFTTHSTTSGPLKWSGGDPKYLGFTAISPGTPAPKEVDVSFDSFEVRQLILQR